MSYDPTIKICTFSLDHDLMEKCAGYAAGMALARFQMPHEVYSQ
jgi:hypothetical protein